MTESSTLEATASRFPEPFSGELLRPGDAGYDESRRVHNGMIDKRPALIARCRSSADVAAAVVTADGRVLTASDEEHPDLFWALRGGGGNFGVVSSFEFRLHAVGPIVAGFQIAYPFAEAEALLRFYRELTSTIPDELTVNAALAHARDGSGVPVAVLTGCHVGTAARAEEELEPVLRFGSPVAARTGPTEYVTMNSLLDD